MGSPYVELSNTVDITNAENFELAMRLKTSIESGDEVFTDLNGYQVCCITYP